MTHYLSNVFWKTLHQKIIVDDVLLYGCIADQLLASFRIVLNFLKHHCATLKLEKSKWFQDRCDFVGVYVAAGGKQLEKSKDKAFFQARAT